MGCLVGLLAAAALIATYGTGLFPFAIAAAVVLFWANGVIANYSHNPLQAPNWAAVTSMIASLAALVLLISGVVVRLSGDADEAVSWEDAADYIGDTKTVCGPLRGMAEDGGDTFLNLGQPYPSTDRFTIVVWNSTDVADIADRAEVCISGEISQYQGVPQVQTEDSGDVEVR